MPICCESSTACLPSPQEQTALLTAALTGAAAGLRQASTPHGTVIADELEAIVDALSPPPESYAGLVELDKALTDALSHLEDLSRCAPANEVQQVLKTLRRTILIDRCRIDPDPRRHSYAIAMAIRQVWLIGHRAGLLKANMQQLQISQALQSGALDPARRAQYLEALDLLAQYIAAQEGYGASIRQEMEELNALLF